MKLRKMEKLGVVYGSAYYICRISECSERAAYCLPEPFQEGAGNVCETHAHLLEGLEVPKPKYWVVPNGGHAGPVLWNDHGAVCHNLTQAQAQACADALNKLNEMEEE